jgi:hypothetical protein
MEHTSPMAHAVPQAPQLAGSVAVSEQTPPHTIVPIGHAHVPMVQVRPPVHAIPQPPQFMLLASVFTQRVPQAVRVAGQLPEHRPATHASPAAHAVPQAPQFVVSVAVSTQPDAPQSSVSPGHSHTPALQS